MEAVAARYKRRHSSFISVFILSARARARQPDLVTVTTVSVSVSVSVSFFLFIEGWSRFCVWCFVWHSEGGWSGDPNYPSF